MADAKRTAAVVVFIPPAVDPGEPPISIRIIIIIWPASVSAVSSTVLKPAVLGVTDWNMDASTFSGTEKSAHAPFENSQK